MNTATIKSPTVSLAQWNLLVSSTVNNGQQLWGSTTKAGRELASQGLGTIRDGKFFISEAGRAYYAANKK